VSAPGDYDNGEIGGMIGRGNRSTRRKPAPVPLCPPQTPHVARTRTRAAAVGSQRLSTLATARPSSPVSSQLVTFISPTSFRYYLGNIISLSSVCLKIFPEYVFLHGFILMSV
jgi:hypothetical protein